MRSVLRMRWHLASGVREENISNREKRKNYEEHPEEVDKILMDGTERARKKPQETMKKVKKAMRLNYFESDN